MGELLIETKRFADAIPGLEKAVAASPTSGQPARAGDRLRIK